jgi:hypothetical protein
MVLNLRLYAKRTRGMQFHSGGPEVRSIRSGRLTPVNNTYAILTYDFVQMLADFIDGCHARMAQNRTIDAPKRVAAQGPL